MPDAPLFFSREDPWTRPGTSAQDSVWIVEIADGKLARSALVDPSTGKPAAEAAPASLKDGELTLVLPAAFYQAQRALAVGALGFDADPCGWPFDYWRVVDKPYMWARQAP